VRGWRAARGSAVTESVRAVLARVEPVVEVVQLALELAARSRGAAHRRDPAGAPLGQQEAREAHEVIVDHRLLHSDPMADADLEVTAQDAHRRHAAGEIQLVDVREPHEWEAGRIPGDVAHIPMGALSQQAATIDRDKPVVFQCHSGARSLMAAQAFRAAGYDAYSLAGGLLAWEDAGLPVDGAVVH
jgi:rhodanese-related sulfurtransferase